MVLFAAALSIRPLRPGAQIAVGADLDEAGQDPFQAGDGPNLEASVVHPRGGQLVGVRRALPPVRPARPATAGRDLVVTAQALVVVNHPDARAARAALLDGGDVGDLLL